jgi:1-aminocyclopropane-1-carboxylate deaminase/D-cysteine desulfhydrase-like pyridoxal-dependent ACC family enzyme
VLLDLASSSKYSQLVSYGGSQGNMMLALAHLAKEHNLQFRYYTHRNASNDANEGNLSVCSLTLFSAISLSLLTVRRPWLSAWLSLTTIVASPSTTQVAFLP